jgi:hypothetical protein
VRVRVAGGACADAAAAALDAAYISISQHTSAYVI